MFPKLEGEISSRMNFMGRERIVWSINNYLGLANHPEVRKADADAAAEWGLAYPMGARLMSGETKYHEQLENELATFVNKEAGLLLNYGYQGIMSIVDALLERHDVVVYDKDCHACIYDGIRMHLGKRLPFEHNDINSFAKQIAKAEVLAKESKGGVLVITEGVFGMRGEQGILKEIAAYKQQYNFRLLVDDAHGFGTLGKTGAGAGEEQGIQDDIDLYFSTFAKSMASIGAFVAGEAKAVKFLRYNLRSQIFAKSLPMPIVIGNLKRLDLLRTNPSLKDKLWENVKMLQDGLKEHGFDIGNTNSCVTPVFLKGDALEAAAMVQDLRDHFNIFCSVVVYPVIPKGMILLRLIPTAVHTKADIDETIQAFASIESKLKGGVYAEHAKLLLESIS
ncbi:MAG: aminotransferase class I/II-fold pyridoxal phosphate-dependent enzyme [Saprospiraceae bacterium]|nr:aminotransferase class I/II-fold pyridoxal phosphate-dependent enzyme [Saprospiraceae bacterium]MDP4822273.1 aminotransferase class I/II-fold pyridoxal phosphate-dependent enzyme [Saprospiraceae bacterium]MDP4999952.1 aminotransferase class I/II-fold pyridoxal phosphate-dependent enzyme [Saprospiraceae bacterium]